jgi:site-specific recombinase XerD
VKIGNDGKRWIYITRTKTNTLTQVPLLPIAEEILKRYVDHPRCTKNGKLLPVPCNQVMNRRLKVVAKLCGIKKVVQTHTGRHTYATTILLGNGVTMETTSKLLGHSNIRTTQIYGKITETKIAQDLVGLGDKLKKKMRR